jgi:hypothetical protein
VSLSLQPSITAALTMPVLVLYTLRKATRPWAERLENPVLFPAEEELSLLCTTSRLYLRSVLFPVQWVTGIKRQGSETDRSLISSTEAPHTSSWLNTGSHLPLPCPVVFNHFCSLPLEPSR